MNHVRLAFTFLIHKPLMTFITVAFLILPVIIITCVVLFNQQTKKYFRNNTGTIDLIIAARSSPDEILKKTVFLEKSWLKGIGINEAREVINNPDVKLAVPVYIEDYYHGHPLVGTNENYPKLFNANLGKGTWWKADFGVVLGFKAARAMGLKTGSTFTYPADSGTSPARFRTKVFHVTGILKKNNSAIDNAMITSLNSVWLLHADEKESRKTGENQAMENSKGKPGLHFPDSGNQVITAALIDLDHPMPSSDFINDNKLSSEVQAIEPVAEITHDYQSLQFTLSALTGSGVSVLMIGLLALFIRLFYFVRERSNDLLLLRKIGATKNKVMIIVILQGLLITDMAVFSGILLAHGTLGILSTIPSMESHYGLTGTLISGYEVLIYLGVITAGCLVSIFPAIKARNIHTLLISTDF